MTPELWKRVNAALDRMEGLLAEEREAALNRLRASEPEVAAEVEKLLPPLAGPTKPDRDPTRSLHLDRAIARVFSTVASVPAAPLPTHIGRYRVEKLLGKGGFGLVYLARDDQLSRPVAIKVPHPDRVKKPEDAGAYLKEARTVANLDHPNIVPVHDLGSTEEFPCFIVSKYIDGTDLAARLKETRLSFQQVVELVATVAEALHHAHKQGLVHRDIKPGNILLDRGGKPFVTDFGLALREQDLNKGPRYAGTPAYMSPEQARGEGHRVDGRSDIFSLGIVFYELLAGKRPFRAETHEELIKQISVMEPRPPRQIDELIPKELERICLKALAKRASERYSAAIDLAVELRQFLGALSSEEKSTLTRVSETKSALEFATPIATPATPLDSSSQPVRIVPKGLRSFDATDADFFLNLLPGPRDREGLPDIIRFWKTRIESRDADRTFAVGLIYGPSGCGKSSLVKAGLVPRLTSSVHVIYVEATGEDTEARLLKGLRKALPELSPRASLRESLSAIRRGHCLKPGDKVLLVLDQFEQWLHARRSEEIPELVQALRHCDGEHLQAVVMVRDDFWLAVSRFMQALEIPVMEGENSRLVDLFDPRHARKVLAAFGRAFGALPEADLARDQEDFLTQAVEGLAESGKVISVRLSLFAEMVKGKPWTPLTLKNVGGMEGVGTTFLEETFTASTAPPQHRLHQRAAQAVLKALLPGAGTDIKGHMRSRTELIQASGYAGRPRDFDGLLQILDSEIRLITPTDPEGKDDVEALRLPAGEKYYQLTHDYLVPSLRDWLTRKQKESRRGRAEVLLADQAAVWNARPENRQLPSLWQWLNIRWLTSKKTWTLPQKKMMQKAGRYHLLRSAAAGLFLGVVAVSGLVLSAGIAEQKRHDREQAEERRKATYAAGLVNALVSAETADSVRLNMITAEMEDYRPLVDPLLRLEFEKGAPGSKQKLHAGLALLPVDATLRDYLFGRLLEAAPAEVPVVRDFLFLHKDAWLDRLWAIVENPEKESQRLRAAAALAKYDPDSERWAKVQDDVAADLVIVPSLQASTWMEVLYPVRARLIPPLARIYRDPERRETERSLATDLLADYAADSISELAELLMDGDARQFAVIFAKLQDRAALAIPFLVGEIAKKLPEDLPSSDEAREVLAKRQANAAVALLKLDHPANVWQLLQFSPDSRLRSYLIHRLFSMRADARAIVKQLETETDLTIRRALVLSLGEYDDKTFPPADRQALVPKLQAMFCQDADPGLHAAVEWLLRRWGEERWLAGTYQSWVADGNHRAKRMDEIKKTIEKTREKSPPSWYVNSRGQTMVVIPGPVEFMMGSPVTEKNRYDPEIQRPRRIGRSLAISAKPVTWREYLDFDPESHFLREENNAPTLDCPVNYLDWYMAARYCNWLSEQEGLKPCYVIKGETDIKLKAGYLSLSGYRLPTEAEMEFAMRAGTKTSRHYGETEELLAKYSWYISNSKNRTWPVGSLKPNELGLFDSLGNVQTWCLTRNGPVSKELLDDREETLAVDKTSLWVLRGGSLDSFAADVRSAGRFANIPTVLGYQNGFRLARTFVP